MTASSSPHYILGISALYHDAAAVLLKDGQVVGAAQEERFTRIKHDRSLPVRAVRWCLEQADIGPAALASLVFYEKPLRKFDRILTTTVATFPRSWRMFPRAMHAWLGDKLWLRNTLASTFHIPPSRILFSEHHLSHAASAFLASPFSEAAILTVDGVGEWATTSLWRGLAEPPFVQSISEIRYPHSIGLFYSAITAYLGFVVNEGEYKVMGMAAFGQPRYQDALQTVLRLDAQGGFSLDMDHFAFHYHPTESASPRLAALLGGPPRHPHMPFAPRLAPDNQPEAIVAESQRYADVAASAQAVTEAAMLHLAHHAHRTVGSDNLCLAGGVALNSVANRRLALDGPFRQIWAQPAAGDAGGALGAALWAWHCLDGAPRTPARQPLALGARWTRAAIQDLLDDLGFAFTDLGSAAAAALHAADAIAEGQVIGWFEGRFEWGPRALGHRSILADPRSAEMQEVVNRRIKFREPFRPFAPAVLAEVADEWFDIPPAARGLTPFMLSTAGVWPAVRDRLQAVTHVDGSARVQLVHEQDSPVFHRLIAHFGQRTGVPVVLNTSFNLKGEPIVSSPLDAIATLMRCGLDALYLEGFHLPRPERPRRREVSPEAPAAAADG